MTQEDNSINENTTKKSLQEEAGELMKLTGKIKGDVIKNHQNFILSKEGSDGFQKVEQKMIEIGCPFDFKKIQTYEMYPVSVAILIILVAMELFDWGEKEIKESAVFNIKNSFILRTFLRYFVSLDTLIKKIPDFWKKNYDFGEMEIERIAENKIIVKIKDYNIHPINCIAFSGMTEQFLKYVIKDKKTYVEEMKCTHKGDDFHEFLIYWE